MATRLPKIKNLEEAEQLMNQLMKQKALLQEDERKADARRKIILGGAVIALSKVKPDVALAILRHLDPGIVGPRDRKDVEDFLPGGSVFEGLVAGGKTGRPASQKTPAPEASSEQKLSGDRVEKPSPIDTVSEGKISAPVAQKPIAPPPIAGEKSNGSAEKNGAGNGAGGVGSLPFAPEEKPVGPPRAPVGAPLPRIDIFGSKKPAAGASPAAD
jgi:hypothetical protein